MQYRDNDLPERSNPKPITPERWRQIKEIFFVAADCEPVARAATISDRCGNDDELRADVESFMRAHDVLNEKDRAIVLRGEGQLPRSLGRGQFTIQNKLGNGGFGTVYRAYDRKHQRWVALKVLRSSDVDAVSRFKREFRTIADLHQHHLVRCYELFSEGETTFFTMELIDGLPMLDYLHRLCSTFPLVEPCGDDCSDDVPAPSDQKVAPDFNQIFSVFGQLSRGVRDLHASGWLHGDLKPSNVLVDRDGRVVILDLGLTTNAGDSPHDSSRIWGTPSHMAPELFEGAAATESSDWYSVGVMLYQAITGRLPWSGTWLKFLDEKTRADPPPPHVIFPAIPAELDRLCQRLLSRTSSRRPTGDEVVHCLTVPRTSEESRIKYQPLMSEAPFVGRNAHLASLREALAVCGNGCASVVQVEGVSGIGKTTLVRRFLWLLRQELGDEVVILEGRCFQHESIPYRAFDGVIDMLGKYLKRLPVARAESLLPRNVHELSRVFPALQQAKAVRCAPRRRFDTAVDGLELRTKAFDALRELLGRIAHERPLVAVIDDLHWGDRDSAALLRHLLSSADAPPMLLVVTYRAEFNVVSILSEIHEASKYNAVVLRHLPVEAFEHTESQELATLQLGERHPSIPAIVREADGIPFFVNELVSQARATTGESAGSTPRTLSLNDIVLSRLEHLPSDARRLLEVLSVGPKPLLRWVAYAAAELEVNGRNVEEELCTEHWAKPCRTGEFVEPYHDRVREAVEATLPPDRHAEIHRRIAQALESSERPDADDLAAHYQAAGDHERASRYAVLAAAEASRHAAFNRASTLYRLAIELKTPDKTEDAVELLMNLGDAQANAGLGRGAAQAYQAAARLDSNQAAELNRRAAEQLLRIGEVDHGLAVMAEHLGAGSWRTHRSPVVMLGWALLRMAWLRFRGLGFRLRAEKEVPRSLLVRADMARTALLGLSIIDPVRALCIQSHHMLAALKTGESSRIALALVAEAAFAALRGNSLRSQRLIEVANGTSPSGATPLILGSIGIARLFYSFYQGKWADCRDQADEIDRILAEECTGVHWELAVVRALAVGALIASGELRECSRRLSALVRDARERGDLLAEALLELLGVCHIVHLAQNQPMQVIDDLHELGRRLPPKRFPVVGYSMCFGLAEAALYENRSSDAEAFLESGSSKLRRAFLHFHPLTRMQFRHLRARTAIMLALQNKGMRDTLLTLAASEARLLRKERDPRARGFVSLIDASLASLRGDNEAATTALTAAEDRLQSTGMGGYAMIARWLRGNLLPAGVGDVLVRDVETWAATQGVQRLDRFAATFVPGVARR